jgi:hypothetical protein
MSENDVWLTVFYANIELPSKICWSLMLLIFTTCTVNEQRTDIYIWLDIV